ncbi:MAG TPA: hypothetical protein VMZ53_31005 [Kofleriaceae bacterium]|nr:hypothetical protein [Kofleriaceae bacterium]
MVSAFLHVVVVAVWWFAHRPKEPEKEYVDIEMAPAPPKAEALPAEVAKPPESSPAATTPTPPGPEPSAGAHDDEGGIDAGIDAPIDAPPKKKKKRPDAALVAEGDDAGADDGDASQQIALADAGAGDDGAGAIASIEDATVAEGSAVAVEHPPVHPNEPGGSGVGSGVVAATEQGSGSGAPGMDNQPAVDGAPTSAGTAANLLAYFPAGHQITALVRFDRLRGTEWAEPAEKLFQPMPDYRALFGARDAKIADKLDSLVISTPRPRDVVATTLVGHSSLSRADLRTFLSNPDTPIKWSTTNGGLYGTRSGKLFQNDRRVLLSPWKNWFVLAQPEDVAGLTTATKGSLDTAEAKAKLPAWLAGIRTIEQESEEPASTAVATPAKPTTTKRGPALVLTLVGPGKRYKFPDVVGLGITSAPSPVRLSLAMELVKQGWLVRGNIVFATEADATEFAQTAKDIQQRINDSRFLSGILKKQHAYNAVAGLSVAQSGARVSYATSLSIADARAVMAVMAATLTDYFEGQQP